MVPITTPSRPPTTAPWIKRVGANVALVVVTLLVGLLAAELAVRVIRPQQLQRDVPTYRSADTIGYEHIPDLRARVNTGERPVDLFTDREGYRIGKAGRIEADTRVLVVGDSFMEALQVQHEQTLAGLLERRLPGLVGRPVAVRNAGVSGYNASQYVIAARRAAARAQFDVAVVSIFLGNDLSLRQLERIQARDFTLEPNPIQLPRKFSRGEFKRALIFPFTSWITRRSHLAQLAWSSTELLRIRLGLWQGRMPDVLLRTRPVRDSTWRVTAGICAEIQKALPNTKVVFVLVPTHMQMDTAAIRPYARALGLDPAIVDPDQPNRLLSAAMREQGLQTIDALPALRAAHHSGQPVYGRVDQHLSPRGHEVLYGLVQPIVSAHLATLATARPEPSAGRSLSVRAARHDQRPGSAGP